jgi:hypothetical protein
MKGLKYKETKHNYRTEVAVIHKQNVILFLYIRQDNYGFYVLGGHEDEFRTVDGDYKRFVTREDALQAIKEVDYTKIETRTCIPLKDVKF